MGNWIVKSVMPLEDESEAREGLGTLVNLGDEAIGGWMQ